MTNKERSEKLAAARELVTAVAFSLDISTTPCSHCDLHKFNNYEDRKTHEQLSAIERKLQNLSENFKRKQITEEDHHAIRS